jgi:hypothetical protein
MAIPSIIPSEVRPTAHATLTLKMRFRSESITWCLTSVGDLLKSSTKVVKHDEHPRYLGIMFNFGSNFEHTTVEWNFLFYEFPQKRTMIYHNLEKMFDFGTDFDHTSW